MYSERKRKVEKRGKKQYVARTYLNSSKSSSLILELVQEHHTDKVPHIFADFEIVEY